MNTHELDQWIETHGKKPEAAIPLLQAVQTRYGYLPKSAMEYIVAHTEISAHELYGVATFYSQFRLNPVGKHVVKVCKGTACHVRGAEKVDTAVQQALHLQEGHDTTSDGLYTLEHVACVGCCSIAPVMVIDDAVHGDLTGAKTGQVLAAHRKSKGGSL